MPARFADTMKALKAGITKMTPAQGVKNIETWEEHVAGLEIVGAKTLHADLGLLKRALQKEPIDGMAVGRMMAKLAVDTVRISARAEGKRAEQASALGAALEQAAASAPAE